MNSGVSLHNEILGYMYPKFEHGGAVPLIYNRKCQDDFPKYNLNITPFHTFKGYDVWT